MEDIKTIESCPKGIANCPCCNHQPMLVSQKQFADAIWKIECNFCGLNTGFDTKENVILKWGLRKGKEKLSLCGERLMENLNCIKVSCSNVPQSDIQNCCEIQNYCEDILGFLNSLKRCKENGIKTFGVELIIENGSQDD